MATPLYDTAWYLPDHYNASGQGAAHMDAYCNHLARVGFTGFFIQGLKEGNAGINSTVSASRTTNRHPAYGGGTITAAGMELTTSWFNTFKADVLDVADSYGLKVGIVVAWGNTYIAGNSNYGGHGGNAAVIEGSTGNAYDLGVQWATQVGEHNAVGMWIMGGDNYRSPNGSCTRHPGSCVETTNHGGGTQGGVWAEIADGISDTVSAAAWARQEVAYHTAAWTGPDQYWLNDDWNDIQLVQTGHGFSDPVLAVNDIMTVNNAKTTSKVYAAEMKYESIRDGSNLWTSQDTIDEYAELFKRWVRPTTVTNARTTNADKVDGIVHGHNARWQWGEGVGTRGYGTSNTTTTSYDNTRSWPGKGSSPNPTLADDAACPPIDSLGSPAEAYLVAHIRYYDFEPQDYFSGPLRKDPPGSGFTAVAAGTNTLSDAVNAGGTGTVFVINAGAAITQTVAVNMKTDQEVWVDPDNRGLITFQVNGSCFTRSGGTATGMKLYNINFTNTTQVTTGGDKGMIHWTSHEWGDYIGFGLKQFAAKVNALIWNVDCYGITDNDARTQAIRLGGGSKVFGGAIYNMDGLGINSQGGEDCIIEGTRFWDIRGSAGGHNGAIKNVIGDGQTVRHIWVRDCWNGVWPDVNQANFTLEDSLIEYIDDNGTHPEISTGPMTIRHNIFNQCKLTKNETWQGHAGAVYVATAANVTVERNDVLNSKGGIGFTDQYTYRTWGNEYMKAGVTWSNWPTGAPYNSQSPPEIPAGYNPPYGPTSHTTENPNAWTNHDWVPAFGRDSASTKHEWRTTNSACIGNLVYNCSIPRTSSAAAALATASNTDEKGGHAGAPYGDMHATMNMRANWVTEGPNDEPVNYHHGTDATVGTSSEKNRTEWETQYPNETGSNRYRLEAPTLTVT